MADINCGNDAIISTRIEVMHHVKEYFDNTINPDFSKPVTIHKSDLCSIILSEFTTGIHCIVLYPASSYWLRLLNDVATKDYRLCEIAEGLNDNELNEIKNFKNILFTVNGEKVYTPTDSNINYEVDASNIEQHVLNWIEYTQCELLRERFSHEQMYRIDGTKIVETTLEECEELNIPSSKRIIYNAIEQDYHRGFLISAHVNTGQPINENEFRSKKVSLRLGETRIEKKYDSTITHVDIKATIE